MENIGDENFPDSKLSHYEVHTVCIPRVTLLLNDTADMSHNKLTYEFFYAYLLSAYNIHVNNALHDMFNVGNIYLLHVTQMLR